MSNNIFSGIGLPSAYLTEVDNIDFAKSLAMQNSRFIRDIISEQVKLGIGYTELVRKLYLIEYANSNINGKDGDKKDNSNNASLDIELLHVKFPSPLSLNMTNLNDQINNLNTLVDALAEIIDISPEDKEKAVPMFKREMFKKHLPNVDWETIDDITKRIHRMLVKGKNKDAGNNANVPPDDSGADGEDM